MNDNEQAFKGARRCRKTFGSICKNLRQSSLFFTSQAHKALTSPGNEEGDGLAGVQALATDPSVSIADWVHRKNGHHNA